MNLKTICAAAAFFTLGALSTPAGAHHSTAMFDWGHEVTLVGTVNKFEWTQPHTWIWFDVVENGKTVQYGLEGMSPSWLGRRGGWTKHSLNPGDKITMVIYPLRDGRKGGFTVRVTFADGKTLEELPQRVP